MSTATKESKMVGDVEVPHPYALRIKVRDLSILVDNATFPTPEWDRELRKLRLLLLLAAAVHQETSDET